MAAALQQDSSANLEEETKPTGDNGSPVTSELSKSQRKKLAKRQQLLERRKSKRKEEREKKKLRKKQLAQQRDKDGEPIIVKKKKTLMSDSKNKFRVVIDMDFNDYMTDLEIGKAVKQLGRIYALNRQSDNPCQLYISSLKDKIFDRFAKTNSGYKSWDINISDKDYIELFSVNTDSECESTSSNINNQIIYLTGDSDETLSTVDDILEDTSKIYVIGGLVDHNRHKNLCLSRARERNIKTAQIPIKNHLQLCQRHILSTVTVFELMLNVLGSHKQWPDALRACIPNRKIAPGYRQDEKTGSGEPESLPISSTNNGPNDEPQ